ncbi:hypothetical protein LX16_1123 [Stackebrandtia albiflava]|uniref:Uncharacterized protein n=1 Tax=Stackebrandtia albiflava TaxID=406432 RepID=A0A562VC33_9ACTN|nr:hypothetical protein [Stackebrandtia albiflava]TWJ15418.1 hypothetical protein LX16_1123 [Stackebrandtia albiflava]
MLTLFAMSLPGLVVLLFLLALVDQLAVRAGRTRWIPWRGSERTGQVSSTGFAQLHVAFEPSKATTWNSATRSRCCARRTVRANRVATTSI